MVTANKVKVVPTPIGVGIVLPSKAVDTLSLSSSFRRTSL